MRSRFILIGLVAAVVISFLVLSVGDGLIVDLLWFDSLGYFPPSPASGGWSGKSLILVRGSLRGNARHVYEILDDNSYSMKIQFSPDAEGWSDVLTGVYRRIT